VRCSKQIFDDFYETATTPVQRGLLPAEYQAPIAAAAASRRRYAVPLDVGQQHVRAMAGRLLPHDSRASPRHIFGTRASRPAPRIKSQMIHRVTHRHALGVTLCGLWKKQKRSPP
jgi:hypothetical protein